MAPKRVVVHRVNVPIEIALRSDLKVVAAVRGMTMRGAIAEAVSQWVKRFTPQTKKVVEKAVN